MSAILGCIFSHSRSIYFKNFSGGACPRTPLGRLRLRRALKMPSAFYLAPPIAKMLRGPCVDLEVLEILKSWRHMCGAILFPNIRSTWRNGKESIRSKRLVYGMLNSSFCESYFQLCLFVFALILLPDQLIKTDKP